MAIDWASRAVTVDARVVLTSGPLEFLACFAGKEHESVLRFDASALHVFMALGLVGLQPGRPARWDEEAGAYLPPEGDLVELWIQYEEDGHVLRVHGLEWTVTCEYGRPPASRPWIFAGSKRLSDGGLTADRTGEGVALVDMPNCLLALSRSHGSGNDELWLEANSALIPPRGTKVRVMLKHVESWTPEISVDFRGSILIDGCHADAADLADVLLLYRRVNPEPPPAIKFDRPLRSDLSALRRLLIERGVPPTSLRFEAVKPTAAPSSPE